jgi:hypothetical protein
MDLQNILDANTCAAYVDEYVNISNRGIIHLHRELMKVNEENLEYDYTKLITQVQAGCAQKARFTERAMGADRASFVKHQHHRQDQMPTSVIPAVGRMCAQYKRISRRDI